MTHELSKMIYEQPLEIEANEDGAEIALDPIQKEKLNNTVVFSKKDKRSPIARTVVGGAEKYKEFLKDKEREARNQERMAKALEKQ